MVHRQGGQACEKTDAMNQYRRRQTRGTRRSRTKRCKRASHWKRGSILCGCLQFTKRLEGKKIVTFNQSSIVLKDGFTYEDYIIKKNEVRTSYTDICEFLGLTLNQARTRYDRLSRLHLDDIGTIKRRARGKSPDPPMDARPKQVQTTQEETDGKL